MFRDKQELLLSSEEECQHLVMSAVRAKWTAPTFAGQTWKREAKMECGLGNTGVGRYETEMEPNQGRSYWSISQVLEFDLV